VPALRSLGHGAAERGPDLSGLRRLGLGNNRLDTNCTADHVSLRLADRRLIILHLRRSECAANSLKPDRVVLKMGSGRGNAVGVKPGLEFRIQRAFHCPGGGLVIALQKAI